MIINRELPPGLTANTAAVLGISLGNLNPHIIGPDCRDSSGRIHRGITNTTVPVLAAESEELTRLHCLACRNPEIQTIGFSRTAQKSMSYSDYAEKLSLLETESIVFSGICLAGDSREVNRLTGSLPLLR